MSRLLLLIALLVLPLNWLNAQPPAAIPSAEEIAELLRKEPITAESWPAWKGRLRSWTYDRSRKTDKAFDAARSFARRQSNAQGEVIGAFADDAMVWYFLSGSYFYDDKGERNAKPDLIKAERALRRSIKLDPRFAQAHRNLALVLMIGDQANLPPRLPEAARELEAARLFDPKLPLRGLDAELALRENRPEEAERLFRKALQEEPDAAVAVGLANAILVQKSRPGSRATDVKALLDRFPNDGTLICFHGLALALENDPRGAVREFDRARALGTDPTKVFPEDMVRQIEDGASPGMFERLGWVLAGFVGFYALVLALMALFGVILASRTQGKRALDLLDSGTDELLANGNIARFREETLLARLYMLGLVLGLVFFYVAIPFIVAGLLGGTAFLLYLIFMMGRVPVKLIVIVVVLGLGMTWAVLKSLFSKPASGVFGIPKTAQDQPRLHALVRGTAERVDTDPVDEVYLAPGGGIGVHQEGRGPFGMFGVKRRVLTLGLSTMRFLTVGELQAILAHEYAHFSHKDTFYSRFIYQVHLSISQALQGMHDTAGALNYVNPFYGFLYLYYKCYTLLSAGFSRSREFLADRMASYLYGSEVFTRALTKVCTDGTLFEMTMYDSIADLLKKQQAFVNMYDVFKDYRDQQLPAQEREELYQKLLGEKGSLFASHPTFGERIDAIADLPTASQTDNTPACQLFDNVEEIEKELTQFLTDYMAFIQQLQIQAEEAAAQ